MRCDPNLVAGLALCILLTGGFDARAAEAPSSCIDCHSQEEDESMSAPVEEWRRSVHAVAEVGCDGCHGGDPLEEDEDLSMDEDQAGFLGAPGRKEITEFCAACHEDVARSFGTSEMGQQLLQGKRVATCVTCHMLDGHAIGHADPKEILTVERCSECHEGERAILLRDSLVQIGEVIEGADLGLARIRHGIDTSVLDREVRELRERLVVIAHSYDIDRIREVSDVARARLEHVEAETARRAAEFAFRRRVGAFVVTTLGVALAGALLLSNRLSKRRTLR